MNLYQLPNGDWIAPKNIDGVFVYEEREKTSINSHYVVVRYLEHSATVVFLSTLDKCNEIRNKIATEINMLAEKTKQVLIEQP